jgi:aminopeptidase
MAVKPGEKVLIEATAINTFELVECLIEEVANAGGQPFYRLHDDNIKRMQLKYATKEQFELEASLQRARMEAMDCFVGIRGSQNVLELSDVPADKLQIMSSTIMKKVHIEVRVPKTRWVVLRYPNPSFAQAAKMSTRQFEDFYFNACLLDYSELSHAMDPLVDLMDKTDRVHIKGPGTDLKFSISGLKSIKCDGKLNIPDGEVFTAPVRDSVNGVLTTNTPTLYEGNFFEGVRMEFKDGKIIAASCNVGDQAKLDNILNRDEGARYIGEFAIGCNPNILAPMLDILFDEKIAGSFHFTPGGAYDEADNGNKSEVHWDMVTRQFPQHGGGEIWFDDVLIRKDGMFILDSLKDLNPTIA